MKTKAGLLIAISEQTLSLAESRISGCMYCTDRADTPFEEVIDELTESPEPASYVLPMAAACPMCQSLVLESTPVQRRERATELFFKEFQF